VKGPMAIAGPESNPEGKSLGSDGQEARALPGVSRTRRGGVADASRSLPLQARKVKSRLCRPDERSNA